MAEDLQSLLDRINRDGVEKANSEAKAILAEAKAQADALVRDGQSKADALLLKARQEEKAMVERGQKALDQAARDLLLSLGDAIQSALQAVVLRDLGQALSPDTLRQMLVPIVEAYARQGKGTIEVLVSPSQQQALADFFLKRFAEEMRKGLQVKADQTVLSGFRVSWVGDKIQHDFTQEALADALGQLLRPQLAELVRKAAASSGKRAAGV
jgi:V/A-type H+-transporting ATPase subunit E